MSKLSSSLQNSAYAAEKLAESLRVSAFKMRDNIDAGRLLSESAGIYEGLTSALKAWSSFLTRRSKDDIMMGYITWLALYKSCNQLTVEINEREIAMDNAIKKLELKVLDDIQSNEYAISGPISISHLTHVGFSIMPPYVNGINTNPPCKVPPPQPKR